VVLAAALWPTAAARAEYPDRPISIIVHTKPGGAIDLTARVVAKIAREYTDVPFIVENRYGGSGALAMRTVLGRPPDGYTLLAAPATFVSTVQITQSDFGMGDFYFLACLTEAPEALITNRNSDVVTFEDIVADARAKGGRQIWVGPGVGSLDHLMAIKTWDKLGITATWVPYDGGGAAVAALLGGNGAVYVGNPEDTRGRPDLQIAVVSARASTRTSLRSWSWAMTFQTRSCGAASRSGRARHLRSSPISRICSARSARTRSG
jgi:putative tricarboxylic transport membrane protein